MKSDLAPKLAGTVVVSAIILIGAYFVLSGNQPDETTSQVTVTTTTQTETAVSPTSTDQEAPADPVATDSAADAEVVVTTYTNGTYSASKTYRVPEGHTEEISVEVTVSSDRIKVLSVDTVATNDESAEYQTPFDNAIQGEVSGEDLDSADVSRLSGASLTSNAFNDLLDAIRTQARS